MNRTATQRNTIERVLLEIQDERRRQDLMWGVQDLHPIEWLALLGEEFGEACQSANKANFNDYSHHNYRSELIQVAALAVAAIEAYDRQNARGES